MSRTRALSSTARLLVVIAAISSIGSEARGQDIERGALEYAHGVAALQRQDWATAREACAGAARALESDAQSRQQLGRAQLCVVDALHGLGLNARAFGVLAHAVRNLEDGGRTNPRYRADLDRAMGLVGPLSQQIGRVQLDVTPSDVCGERSQPTLTVDDEAAPIAHACGDIALYLDPGTHRISLRTEGYAPMEATVEVRAGGSHRVTLRGERDASSRRWLRLVLREEGTALGNWSGEPCPAPCDQVVRMEDFTQGLYFVIDEDGRQRIEHGQLNPSGPNEIEHVSSTSGWGWLTAITGLAMLTIGAPIAAATDVIALSIGFALGGLLAGLVGLVWGIAAGPSYYGIE